MKRKVLLFVSVITGLLLLGCSQEKTGKMKAKESDLKTINIENPQKDTSEIAKANEKKSSSESKSEADGEAAQTLNGNDVEPKMPTPPGGMKLKELFNSLKLPEVVAKIGGEKINRDDVYNEIESQIPKMMLDAPLPPQACAQLTENINLIVDSMVSRKILLDLAAKDGIKPSPKMMTKKFDDYVQNLSPQQKQMFEAQLKAQGSSIAEKRKEVASDVNSQAALAIDEWINKFIMPQVKVDDEKVEKYYRENQEKFKKPETIKVAHILITPDKGGPDMADKSPEEKKAFAENADLKAKKEAESVLAELKQGGDFAKLAKEKSDCPSKKDGGKLPEFDKRGMMDNGGGMDPTFTAASFKLKPGGLSDVVKTPFGYHIIKCLELNKESYLPIDKVKEYLKNSLEKEELGKKVKTMVDAEKEKQKVVIYLKDKKEKAEK